jgi:hypothetical protein
MKNNIKLGMNLTTVFAWVSLGRHTERMTSVAACYPSLASSTVCAASPKRLPKR